MDSEDIKRHIPSVIVPKSDMTTQQKEVQKHHARDILLVSLLILLTRHIWRRRRFYYLSYKLKGPFSVPFLGSIHIFIGEGYKGLYKNGKKLISDYPSIFKIWIGPYLYVVDSKLDDLQIILNSCLEKAPVYKYGIETLGNGLLTAPVYIWRHHRKIINHTFSITTLNTYQDILFQKTRKLTNIVSNYCGKNENLLPIIFKITSELVCETLFDLSESDVDKIEDYNNSMSEIEKIIVKRFSTPFLMIPCIWKFSTLKKNMVMHLESAFNIIRKIIRLKQSQISETGKENYFLNKLIKLNKEKKITDAELLDEVQIMLITASETMAISLSSILVTFGVHTHLQEQVFQELEKVFQNSARDMTMEDIEKLDFLERVIKETLRLIPTVPVIGRIAHIDITLSDGLVLPRGTNIAIPILQIHRNPTIWPEPLKFNPDRFLPEEVAKRHKLAYIPFSFGLRNCIGFKYAMMSMKVILASILREFKIAPLPYNSLEEIDFEYMVLAKPKIECHITLEQRFK